MNNSKYIKIGGKQYRVAFSFLGMRESQKMAYDRAKVNGQYDAFDDVIQSSYCFIKHCNVKKSNENEQFTLSLNEFEQLVNEDFPLYKELIDAYAFVMSSMVDGLKGAEDEGPDDKKKQT